VLYPQNGDRIVTIDCVTSLHPIYNKAIVDVGLGARFAAALWRVSSTRRTAGATDYGQAINQSIDIRLLRHDKMQANNSKQKGNTHTPV